VVLSDARRPGARDARPSGAAEAIWGRSILERLLASSGSRHAAIVADRLIARFDGLGGILSQSQATLEEAIGHGHLAATTLAAVGEAIAHSLRERVGGRAIAGTDQALIDYLVATMADLRVEQLRVIFLDRRNCMLADEVVARGTVARLAIYPREILRRALDRNASAVILVHNHPGGSTLPGEMDLAATRAIAKLCPALDLVLHDHIIIAGADYYSFREHGLL
jgi:DNA repair protein RadC